ncbi:hypothetical protein JVU11DRAFT_2967 [Chiua virens]|nr:hypothetical protein JVU11DRAFT_2967 [Chiua virens]
MVATPVIPQQLSAREDAGSGIDDDGSWGSMQIATPAIVGGGLFLILAALSYALWRQRATRDRPYTKYRPVPNDWVTKRMFPWRSQQRVRPPSVLTIDDSMCTPGSTIDPPRAHRSYSSDSQTPLTMTSQTSDLVYPPKRKSPDSPPPIPKHHLTLRWWWPFGSRPREVKSQEPNLRWRVDGPDGSSSGHGSHGHEESRRARRDGSLEPLREAVEVDSVIRIGQNFTSVPSTPLTQPEQFIEYTRPVRGMSPVAEHPQRPVRTPVPATNAANSRPGTPLSSANRGLPPSYNVSQSHTLVQYPSAESVYFARTGLVPPPGRTAVYYSSLRGFHGRELSSDSVAVAAQQPMAVATSLY